MSELERIIQFQVLGPLRVHTDAGELAIGAVRERTVLAMLLLHPGEPVTVQRLVDAVWDEAPPQNARNQLQGCVSRLRKQFTATGVYRQVIDTTTRGYQIDVEPHELDLLSFRRLRDEARAATAKDDLKEAQDHYRSSLSLWRGPVLSDVESQVVQRVAAALEEERAQVLHERIEIDLVLGGAAELVAELTSLVEQYPYREAMHAALMRALVRAGRQAEALAAYRSIRELLNGELGTEPGEDLQRLHRAILRQDPDLGLRQRTLAPVVDRWIAPRALPGDIARFAGRLDALAKLDKLLSSGEQVTPGPAVISAIAGAAGVGKTALAVHWAHRVSDRFPDGQLYANLRGFDPTDRAVLPGEAIRGLLDALGVPAARVPADLDAQAALYRSLLAERRVLVLLDNARDAEQVRPLLPGTSTALVVVTSRNQLVSLIASDGARPLTLDLLPADEARELLAARLGSDRVVADTVAVDTIIDACAGLPLALAIAAARAEQSGFPLAAFASELRDAGSRLDALDTGDPASQVRAVFSWSYRALSSPAARLFRLLGLHPGPDFSCAAAASLFGCPPGEARRMVAELVRASLLTERVPGRFTWHDLLLAYATELAKSEESKTERRRALTRLFDHYTLSAYHADRLLDPARRPILLPLGDPAPAVSVIQLASYQQAMEWLNAERRTLLAAVRHASRAGFDTHAWQLAWSIDTFVYQRGYHLDEASAWQAALDSAHRLDDKAAQAFAHGNLAGALTDLHRYDDAHRHLRRGLDLFVELGDESGQARIHSLLSFALGRQDAPQQAFSHALEALVLFRAIDDRLGIAGALNQMGWHGCMLGDHVQAVSHCQQALALYQRLGAKYQEARAWDSLGFAYHHLGDYARAADCYRCAIDLRSQLDALHPQAVSLTHLGDTQEAAGDTNAAHEAWRQALDILMELNHPDADHIRSKLGS